MAGHLKCDKDYIMSRILEVRYTDLDEELMLCKELFEWANEQGHSYAKVFAMAYMGDYYIAVYDAQNAGAYLLEAEQQLEKGEAWDELRMRIYSLLGIYYEMRADEQNAMEYYLSAITVAEKINNSDGACVALNNLAFIFQCHRCYEEAFVYYEKAYKIMESAKSSSIRALLLMNLSEVSLALHRYEEAKAYIEECELSEIDSKQRQIMSYKNWCGYYAKTGHREKARKYGQLYLENQDIINQEKLTAFETYHSLCQNMMHIGDKIYAKHFLDAMEKVCGEELDQIKVFEEMRIKYVLLFGQGKEHIEAYKRFYKKNLIFRCRADEAIANAMKSRIRLDQLVEQTKQMQSEQRKLEKEVNVDGLTGLYSRSYLEGLMQECEESQREIRLGIVILDVDYFKEYNDCYGHIQGDFVLQKIAECLERSKRENIYPCRYGGDELVCICKDIAEAEIEAFVLRVRECLHQERIPHEKSPCKDEVTLSIGYAVESSVQVEVRAIFELADQALYESKRNGRNTYTKKRVDVL